MNTEFKNALLYIDKETDPNKLVQLFELISNKVTFGTIQQIADIENKSYNGIKNSNNYLKININGKKYAVKGVKNNNLPF